MDECTNGAVRDLLPELMHGTLDADRQRAVEAHVASCAECAEELAFLRALRPALARGPVVDAQRIAAAVNARTTRAPRRSPLRTPIRIAIAAATLLAVGGIGYGIARHAGGAAPEATAVRIPPSAARDTTSPEIAPIPAPTRHVAVAPPHETSPGATPAATTASSGVLDNLSDLTDDDVRALTASLDGLSGVPDADPSPVIDPLGASADDSSAGG